MRQIENTENERQTDKRILRETDRQENTKIERQTDKRKLGKKDMNTRKC